MQSSLAQPGSIALPKEPYLADLPEANDQFHRRPFAQWLARTIAQRQEESSLVIGISGPWGDGKTTLLEYLRESLAGWQDVICVRFNPWRFQPGLALLPVFLNTITAAIDAAIQPPALKVHDALGAYARTVSSENPDPGGVRVPTQVTATRLEEQKALADELLGSMGRRMVVLIDDVDRLPGEDIQALFKMIKLTAAFANTVYVLAFDEQVVTAALGATFAPANAEAGRQLLEKAIQVPLHLPKVDPDSLREYLMRLLASTLDPALFAEQPAVRERLEDLYIRGLQVRLHTPRMAKRYVNVLSFSLGLLGSEINNVDLMVIEGVRLFYPALYEVIRTHRDDFVWYRITHDGPEADNRMNEMIHRAQAGLSSAEQEAVSFLVRMLFPTFDRSRYPSREDVARWAAEKRVASPEYFDRFFDYASSRHKE